MIFTITLGTREHIAPGSPVLSMSDEDQDQIQP